MQCICWVHKVHYVSGAVSCLNNLQRELMNPAAVSWNSVEFEVCTIFLYEGIQRLHNYNNNNSSNNKYEQTNEYPERTVVPLTD